MAGVEEAAWREAAPEAAPEAAAEAAAPAAEAEPASEPAAVSCGRQTSATPGQMPLGREGLRDQAEWSGVTAVGATTFSGAKVGAEEIASTSFGSGGGFSWVFDAPDYQKADLCALRAQSGGSGVEESRDRAGRGRKERQAQRGVVKGHHEYKRSITIADKISYAGKIREEKGHRMLVQRRRRGSDRAV